MAEKKTDCTVVPLGFEGPYKSALILVDSGETVNGDDTITLDDEKLYCEEVISVRSHVADTGEANQYSYDDNVLTKETAADTRDIIKVLYN